MGDAPSAGRAERLRRQHEVRTVNRPAAAGSTFPLSYARTGPFDGRPSVVVVPGGPGMGSIVPYAALRSWATKSRIDLIMVEHRGIGLSRRTAAGPDLTGDDMWLGLVVDDLLAVLDAEHVPQAILYGCSYGSYVVQAFASEHADRVSGLVLDSAKLSAHDHDLVREAARATLWTGTAETGRLAAQLRHLVSSGAVTQKDAEAVARIVYEFCGPATLEGLLDQVQDGRGGFGWRRIAALTDTDTGQGKPFLIEFDLVGTIAFRELNFAPEPDGGPFDPGARFAREAARFPSFAGEPFDLKRALQSMQVPVLALAGERDLRTPPAIAQSIADTAPKGHLVPIAAAGHSLLDSNTRAARAVLRTLSVDGLDAAADLSEALSEMVARPAKLSLATYLKSLISLGRLIPGSRRRTT